MMLKFTFVLKFILMLKWILTFILVIKLYLFTNTCVKIYPDTEIYSSVKNLSQCLKNMFRLKVSTFPSF